MLRMISKTLGTPEEQIQTANLKPKRIQVLFKNKKSSLYHQEVMTAWAMHNYHNPTNKIQVMA